MMFKQKLCIALAACSLMIASPISADEAEPKEKSRSEKKAEKAMAKIMKKYAYTGKVKNCLSTSRLHNSQVIDDQTIFFDSVGKKAYMMKLPRKCSRLGHEKRFAYKVSTNQLCDMDLITVLDGYGRTWASCGLGKFEEMERKPKDK